MHRPLGRFLSGRRNFFGWHRIGGRLSMTSSHAPVGQLFWMVDRRFFFVKKNFDRIDSVSFQITIGSDERLAGLLLLLFFPVFFSYWLEDNLFWGPPSGWKTVVCNSVISRA